MKKFLAVLIVIVLVLGWYVTIFGAGSAVSPIKDHMKLGLDLQGGVYVVMEAETDVTGAELSKLMSQTQAVIEKRVNAMGLSEPVVTIEGEKRIRVELPGAEDAEEAIAQIGRTAQLQFIMADGSVVLDGSNVKDASTGMASSGTGYAVNLEFDSEGAKAFEEATSRIINDRGSITTESGLSADCIGIVLDNELISYPSVKSVIPNGRAEITGGFSQEEATNLAALIRGGALPVGLTEVETSIVGPSLGINSLNDAVKAGVVGVIIVLLIMLVFYRVMGFTADIALLLYTLMFLWIIVAFRAVLTLPGIAGMILSVGMAVDANVIIFSRIKEEVRAGKTIRAATSAGFKRAMSTVIDSQVTTLIAGLALYEFGSGAVKGFAFTLMLGIVLSIFTAVVITRIYIELVSESKTFGTKKWYGITEEKEVA